MDLAARRLGSKMTPEHSKNHCRNLAIRTSGVKNDPRQVLVASKICHQWGSGVKMIPHSFRNPCRSLTTWASGVKYDPRHFWKVCDRVTIWASGVKTDPSKYSSLLTFIILVVAGESKNSPSARNTCAAGLQAQRVRT